MAVTRPDNNKALAALTTAALSLPGLNAAAAVPAPQIEANVSYGHYQESDNRMKVDIYHADAVIPLYERVELALSLDRDTYSGATPAFSMPESMTNQPKYKQKDDGTLSNEVSYVDVVSAASGGVTAAGLTILGGLNAFQSFQDGMAAAQTEITTEKNLALTELEAATANEQAELDTSYNANQALVKAAYEAEVGSLNDAIPALTDQYNADVADINAQIAAVPPNIAGPAIIDFNTGMNLSSYAGFANNAPIADGKCAGSGSSDCFYQNGMVVGIVQDSSNPIAHLHRAGTAENRMLQYHSDSSGIYIRSQDSKAFSLDSMDFMAPISAENPDKGPNDFWDILGFNTALNPKLDTGTGNCVDYATCVAYQKVANGFNGTLLLDPGFNNINAVWIHYHGYPQTPADGKEFSMGLDNVRVSPVVALTNQVNAYNAQITALTEAYNAELAALTDPAKLAALTDNFNAQMSALTANYTAQSEALVQGFDEGSAQLTASFEELAKQAAISLYSDILNSQIPTGTPPVQIFQVQPQETRSMPQFSAKYYFDATTMALSGGFSDEPDFLSNFGSVNLSHEFNDKLTTVSGGYGMTSNTITRNTDGHGSSHHASDPTHNPTDYSDLLEDSTFHSFNAGIAQVFSKNTLFQSTGSYTHQSGYLSNPYKYVYVRGEITPEEYYNLWQAPPGGVDWNAVTNLEVVGLELFREVRPEQRNIGSLSNRVIQHVPELDASVHFDYRFYSDDWGINSHAFELKWYQSLPDGFTVTPGIRYYSQSQADFFAPYFLAPRADGNYSSDFRLSAFGDLSGGITISKQFARGVELEAGFEYVTHRGSLKLGGGGVGNYADFDYYLAHANLNVDLSGRSLTGGEHGDHKHHHHGAPVPAGVMYGHMMNKADSFMAGFRYMWNEQNGTMRHGHNAVSDQDLVSNACDGFPNGCLYKPTSMHMNMYMLDLMYAPTDWLNLMLMPQLMSMEMTMSDPIRPFANQTEENDFGGHGGATHNSNDLGDTVVTALVKVLDTNGHHVHLGLGISAPSGSIDAELDSTNLQDYGMQLGSGTWDFKPSLTYTGQFNDWSWGAQLSGVKRLDKNANDYAYGDIFQATGWGSYQIFNWLSVSVRNLYTAQGHIQGESSHARQLTATVDYPGNYGGRFLDVGFGLNAMASEGHLAGHSLSFEWLQPVMNDFNGYQLDRNGALAVSWSYSF